MAAKIPNAEFNRRISAGNTYKLSEVITLTNFTGTVFRYSLVGDRETTVDYKINQDVLIDEAAIEIKYIYIDDENNLVVSRSASGDFGVLVEDDQGNSATARGTIFSYTSVFSDFERNENISKVLSETRTNWKSIVPGGGKAEK